MTTTEDQTIKTHRQRLSARPSISGQTASTAWRLGWLLALLVLVLDPVSAKEEVDEDLAEDFSAAYRGPSPLTAPASRSPRELMQSFSQTAQEIRDVFAQGSLRADISIEQEQRLIGLYGTIVQLIDISRLPESERFARANAAASQLADVLARLDLPAADAIPGEDQVKAQGIDYWRIPGTTIALNKIKDGPRVGDWVVYKGTIEHMDALYGAALAKTPPTPGEKTLLEHYLGYSGPLISTQITEALPPVLDQPLLGQPLWKYLASALLILLILGFALLVHWVTRLFLARCTSQGEIRLQLIKLILPLLLLILIPVAIQLIAVDIRLRLAALDMVDDLMWLWFYSVATWALLIGANLVAAIIIRSPSISPAGLDASMVRLACRLVAYALSIWVWVEGLQALGLSLIPLLAGVGVSGLAFALAAKPTLGNLLGGVILFADKPFRVGHRVVVGEHQGIIEEIGLRSTRLRTLDGHLVSLPNDEVCASSIENVAARPNIKRVLNVTLTYDTPPEKIRRAIEIIQQLLSLDEDGGQDEEALGRPSNQHLHFDDENLPPRVYFSDLNADSLNILVLYWFTPPDYWDYMAHATWLNLQLIERFNAEGIEFAFPTQTIDFKPREADPALPAS